MVNRPAADLYLTMARAMGAANATFPGTDGRPAGGAGVSAARLASASRRWLLALRVRGGAARRRRGGRHRGQPAAAGSGRHRRAAAATPAPAAAARQRRQHRHGRHRQPELPARLLRRRRSGTPFAAPADPQRARRTRSTTSSPRSQGQWTTSLPASTVSAHGFDNDGVGHRRQAAGAARCVDTAQSLATALVGTPLATDPALLDRQPPNRTCAETFLNKYGRRLFRRPLTTAEHDRYLAFFDASLAKSDFKTALKWMTIGAHPVAERALPQRDRHRGGDGMRQLSPYELATELAYTFTGTTPTRRAADAGRQRQPGDVGGHRARACSRPTRASRRCSASSRSTSATPRVASMQKPNIAGFAAVSADMVQETRAFIDQVVFQNARRPARSC